MFTHSYITAFLPEGIILDMVLKKMFPISYFKSEKKYYVDFKYSSYFSLVHLSIYYLSRLDVPNMNARYEFEVTSVYVVNSKIRDLKYSEVN